MTDTTDQPVNQTPSPRRSTSMSGQHGATPILGFEQYFELVRHQLDLHREFTLTWATAMTSLSTAVFGQLHTVEHILAGQADQLAQHAHDAERMARGMAEQVAVAGKTLGSRADQQPAAPAAVHHRIPTQRTGPHRAGTPSAATSSAAARGAAAPRAATQRTAAQRAANHWTAPHRTAAAQPEPTAGEPDQLRTTPDIFDELIEFIVDEDIKAAIP